MPGSSSTIRHKAVHPFTLDGEQCKMTYTVNYDAVPHTVDFIITSLESGRVVEKQLGIFAFKDRLPDHVPLPGPVPAQPTHHF